jgi:SH3-like domain-containing protein
VSGFASLFRAVSAALFGLVFISSASPATAAATAPAPPDITRGPSGLPLPRFVSLKSGRVNSRIGPGLSYAVDWMYMKPGLPMEIIAPWQRGKQTQISLMAEPNKGSGSVATIEPGVVGSIKTCNGDWCEMTFDGYTGWVSQSLVWGAYPGETVKD